MKKSVLFITNIPAPYRIDFFNELGKKVELTVLFEAKGASDQGIRFNYNLETISNFKAVFLSEGNICEKTINWKIIRFLRKNKFDEIVVTSYSYYTEMIGLIYLKLHKIPYYMETDGGIIRKESGIKRWYKRFLISGAKGYFSPSKSSDDYLVYYGAKKDCIVRYPFTSMLRKDISTHILRPEQKQEYKKKIGAETDLVILGIGQFTHRKGWDVLLEASSLMRTSCDIFIVGGETPQEYKDYVKRMNLRHIHFCDFKAKSELQDYFNAADIFVLPTREDIWGLVINEALSNGLPVITTNMCVAGLELVEDGFNGKIIEADNPQELAVSCEKLLNENLETYSNNALKKIMEYSIENMVEAHITTWSDM